MTGKISKAQASKAGKGLRNPHTPEKKESGYAKTLAKLRWQGKK